MMMQTEKGKKWYCLQVNSNRERSFEKSLRDRIKQEGGDLPDKFGEIFAPAEEVVEMRKGKRRVSARKFFPGYVFIEMEMDPDTWHLVSRMPMIRGFVGDAKAVAADWQGPQPVSDDEIEKIRLQAQEGAERPRPKVMFEAGESVRIKEGPFTSFTGNVVDVNYDSSRISVSVNVFNRPTEIQIDFEQVEKM